MKAAAGDLLARPAEESARRLALELVGAAEAAALRLGEASEEEALHDFRVALRRLRSTLAAYRPLLGKAASKSMRKRLRKMAKLTGAGRDAEVALAWLEQADPVARLPRSQRRPVAELTAALAAERDAAAADSERLRLDFAEVAKVLRRRLTVYRPEVDLAPGAPVSPLFAAAAAVAFDASLAGLRELLAALPDGDPEIRHRTRIALKRLRYVAEPLRQQAAGTEALLGPMRRLQDLLGELQDVRVLRHRIAAAMAAAAAERQRQLVELAWAEGLDGAAVRARARRGSGATGLLRLLEQLRARDLRLRSKLEREWLGGGVQALVAACEEWAERLGALDPSQAGAS